jgi:hypothetical protein
MDDRKRRRGNRSSTEWMRELSGTHLDRAHAIARRPVQMQIQESRAERGS